MINNFDPTKFKHKEVVREEITDIIDELKKRYTPEHFAQMGIKRGKVLKFDYEGSPTIMKITKVAKGRYWAEHIELHSHQAVSSHYDHNVDVTSKPPYCQDCEVPVTEPSTEDGEKKYQDRKDRYLEDGTLIDG